MGTRPIPANGEPGQFGRVQPWVRRLGLGPRSVTVSSGDPSAAGAHQMWEQQEQEGRREVQTPHGWERW